MLNVLIVEGDPVSASFLGSLITCDIERSTPALTLGLLPHKCAMLDRQIDHVVYELYELTPEEIAIVEGGTTK